MASQRLFITLFLLSYISEIIYNKKPKEKKKQKENKGQADLGISPFLILMILGAPAGNIQPNTQIIARKRGVGARKVG